MSTTPAFSPGPCTTSFPRVGRRFRCTLLDLYEQCSLHITLKMPSSVMLGSRSRICWMRSYSSRVTPCSAAISGVTLISALAVAICAVLFPSVHFLFEIAIKSGGPIAGGDAAFFRVHHRLAHFQIFRHPEKRSKFAPHSESAHRAVHSPADVHDILIDNDIRAVVDFGTLQNFFLLRAVEIKPAGLIGILKHGENSYGTGRIEHEIAVILTSRSRAVLWWNGAIPGVFCLLLPVQLPRANKILVAQLRDFFIHRIAQRERELCSAGAFSKTPPPSSRRGLRNADERFDHGLENN